MFCLGWMKLENMNGPCKVRFGISMPLATTVYWPHMHMIPLGAIQQLRGQESSDIYFVSMLHLDSQEMSA